MEQKEIVDRLAEEDCLVSADITEEISSSDLERICEEKDKPFYIDQDAFDEIKGLKRDVRGNVEIVQEIELHKEERNLKHFVQNMNSKFEKLKKLLLKRRSMQECLSIHRARKGNEGEEVTVIGMVKDKYETKKGKYIVYIEDTSSQIKLLVSGEEGNKIVTDEVIGAKGNLGSNIIFANQVIRPGLPIPTNVNSFERELYAAFISDFHFGSQELLKDELEAFKRWLQTRKGKAGKIKYLFVAGDIAEGVGIYPDQEQDLAIKDIYKQYQQFSEFVKQLPEDIEVIVAPGNHDIVRRAEPQPPLPAKVLPDLAEKHNVHLTSNPATVRISGPNGQQAITVLMYHGTSFDAHTASLSYLRKGAYQQPRKVMVDLLKRRHLIPSYGKNPLAPEAEDHLTIERVPDVFVIGHIHSHACSNYKGVNLICASTFQAQTEYQKRIGHVPDPAKVTLLNLKNRKMQVKSFKQ